MLVSFYVQISIIGMALLVILVPFLGIPQSWDDALTAILGVLIFGVGLHALYKGSVRILEKEKRRSQDRETKDQESAEKKKVETVKGNKPSVKRRSAKTDEEHDHSVLEIARD